MQLTLLPSLQAVAALTVPTTVPNTYSVAHATRSPRPGAFTHHPAPQEGDRVVLVQEFADGGDLLSLLQRHGGRLGEKVAVPLVLDPFLRVLHVRTGACACI